MSEGSRLLKVLLKVSEKSANIARVCRQNEHLLQLLIQEKFDAGKNPRFLRDFKTLADVLIQETIRHDIGIEFPDLAKHVKGEENNTFSNTLGESITVEVCPTYEETAKLLEKVLNHDSVAAGLLAAEVHKDIQLSDVPIDGNTPTDLEILEDDLGIWVDPIDSTAEYINGVEAVDEVTGVHLSGLRCVTVLIGAYYRKTGLPVCGVINQPFYSSNDSKWKGICYWGFTNNGNRQSSLTYSDTTTKVVVLSRCENPDVKTKLLENGFTFLEVAGAGYKVLTVILGQADAYILSKPSTFLWDTCAPQAILGALGGRLIDFSKFVENSDSNDIDLKYLTSDEYVCNHGGFIAYRSTQVLESLKQVLSQQ